MYYLCNIQRVQQLGVVVEPFFCALKSFLGSASWIFFLRLMEKLRLLLVFLLSLYMLRAVKNDEANYKLS